MKIGTDSRLSNLVHSMKSFGLKVVDKNPSEINPILDYVLSTHSPLEVGCYFGEETALELIANRLKDTPVKVNTHSNQNRIHIHNLHETHACFATHIQQALTIGSRYSIVHVSNYPTTCRVSNGSTLRKRLSNNLQRAEELCTLYNYRLHIENDFQSISFYRYLFEHIRDLNLKCLHFCLDIGHAKIWSNETLSQWLDFAEELVREGFSIHCHLHANSGFGDEHLSIAEARIRGITEPDGDFNPFGYPLAFWEVDRRLPEAIKIFEVKSTEAIANHITALAARPVWA